MASPTQDAIEIYMSITGATESLALLKLEEYGGNLNEAVNAHFAEGERHITNPTSAVPPQYNFADPNNQSQVSPRGLLPLLYAARSFKPSSLLDPNYRRNLYNQIGATAFGSRAPFSSHMGEVRGVPVEFNYGNEQPRHSGRIPAVEDVNRTSSYHGSEIPGNVTRDDESHLHRNNLDEEMIQAAIEASKRESHLNKRLSSANDLPGTGFSQRQLHVEDDELARVISLSLKTAEQEKAMRQQTLEDQHHSLGVNDSSRRSENDSKPGSSSLVEGAEDVDEQQPLSLKFRHNTGNHPQLVKDAFYSDEWGSISSQELDEALLLETALFGEIPKGTSYRFPHGPHQQNGPDRSVGPIPQPVPRPPSPSLMAQRLLREQQNDEYLASLLADREKEMNAVKDAESLGLKEDEYQEKMLDGEEFERWLAAKEASLPQEPASDDENAVTLLIRMPDGSRHGRRFLKSEKLQFLFDFVDVTRVVKPGTYRVVRPYPRRAFSVSDSSLSLNELGLTSKQEALFLELD